MKVELDNHALICLVRGSVAGKSALLNPLVKSVVWFYGDQRIQMWSSVKLKTLTDEQLWEIYNVCRLSWDNEREELESYTKFPNK